MTPILAFLILGASDPPAPGPLIMRLAEENGCSQPVTDVIKHLHDVAAQLPRNGPKLVARALADPWSVPVIAEELRAGVSAPFASEREPGLFAPLAGTLESWLGEAAPGGDDTFENALRDPMVEGESLVELLADLLAKTRTLAAQSTQGLSDAERSGLRALHRDYVALDFKVHDPKFKASEEEQKSVGGFAPALHKTSCKGTLAAARLLFPLAEAKLLRKLAARLTGLPKENPVPDLFSGDILLVRGDSDLDRIVIGGKGKSVYKGHAALVIDLGGDDVYEQAAVATPEAPIAVVLDLGGKDTYRGSGEGPAYALGGVALLVDLEGNDTYRAKTLAEGSGCAGGIALCVDYEGKDQYQAEGYSQGYGCAGVGLLYDLAGNDSYDGWAYAQGSTKAWGVGALVDWAGNDTYLADQHFADTYGDSGPNVYHGGSQGSSMGLRSNSPGGIAVLVDQGGKDRYQAGNFSQGGGYYYGFGLMYDGGGDDENIGTRYSQGYGVHQAVGVRWDAAGNDSYQTSVAANCGSAWDEGVGYLIDQEGDDTYAIGGLALGGAANTGIAVFLDGGGSDKYPASGGEDTQGGTGDSSYHKKQSLGVMLDLGAGKDQLGRGHKEDRAAWQRWFGLFLDAKEKTLADIMKRKPGKLKGEEMKGRDT